MTHSSRSKSGQGGNPRRPRATNTQPPSKSSSTKAPPSRSGGTNRPAAKLTDRESKVKEPLSGEALALIVLLVSLFVMLSVFTPLFGLLGRGVREAVEVLFASAAGVIFSITFLAALAHLARAELTTRRMFWWKITALAIDIAAIDGSLFQGVKFGFGSAYLRAHGGLVGESIGGGLALVASKVGATIILGLIGLLCLLWLFGVGFDRVAKVFSKKASSSLDAMKSAKSGGSPEPEVDVLGNLFPVISEGDSGHSVGEVFSEGEGALGQEADDETEEFYVDLSEEAPTPSDGPVREEVVADPDDLSTTGTGHKKTAGAIQTWKLPPPSILSKGVANKIDQVELADRGRALQGALMTHGVPTRLSGMTVGPTVTRYELELGEGIKVAKLLSLQRDIAYAMAAADIRILAPIPGKSAIGVEVPNRSREVVTLGDVLLAPEMKKATLPLEVPLGRDIYGRTIVSNLADMPHVLIAGATGSGKSSALNSMITSILMRATPAQVRMILVDPKRVELGQYSRLPHLLSAVVVDPKRAAGALNWATKEMDRRYDLLAGVGVRNITGYNELAEASKAASQEYIFDPLDVETPTMESLPYIIVVVDELNDLMMVAPRDVEDSICRIAQKARAVGIHLLIATQRPSVDVITGVIKANVPSRMAFSVASQADSRVILDQPGAEKLIGKGDMLIVTADSSVPRRIQTPWVSESEVRGVVGFWLRQSGPAYLDELEEVSDGGKGSSESGASQDEYYNEALRLVVSSQLGSTSMLQRKLKVGFARAGRLMDLLEQDGVVGPSEGSKPREVLMSKEELDELSI
ncbi:MAG: DNA translocase FtsK [Acidimicrobiaceae bacterium]|nr:DNA translocase FtsK [Acidimicrobiaceae bacterium]